MRYENAYVWLVFVSALDIMLTWAIITKFGGREVNPIADLYHKMYGIKGLILFKFCIMLGVIVICEIVGRRDDRRGRWLSRVGVGISAVPSFISAALLFGAIYGSTPDEG